MRARPIHILVGYAAGGGVDIVARLLQEPMKVGTRASHRHRESDRSERDAGDRGGRKGAPDGYTLLACASGEVAINHFLFKERMSYDPAKELVPIALDRDRALRGRRRALRRRCTIRKN